MVLAIMILMVRGDTPPVCGSTPLPLNVSTPNVLIVGDSISMGFGVNDQDTGYGYGLNVAKMLQGPFQQFYSKSFAGGLATVQHAGGFGINGGDSAHGMACMDSWLGGLQWDVVTINTGLHDCSPANRTTEAVYAKNLETMLNSARKRAKKVIFVTTTPFFKYKAYSMPCVLRYNQIAKQMVAQLNSTAVEVADLFAHVEAYCGQSYSSCPIQLNNNLHFSTAWSPPYSLDKVTGNSLQRGPRPSGQQYTGLLVARAIQRALPASEIQPPINASSRSSLSVLRGRGSFSPNASLHSGDSRDSALPCGLPPSPPNESIPNVLIIGDSVSDSGSGYGQYVRRLLETSTGNDNSVGNNPRNNGPLAQVQHNGGWAPAKGANEQAANTANGVRCIQSWLSGFKWDVVSFNFGIHDCWKPEFVNATEYRANLETIYNAIKGSLAPGGKIVWTSTTPIAANCGSPSVPRGPCYGVSPQCVRDYNAIAQELFLGKEGTVVNDVFSAVTAVCGEGFETCSLQHQHDVHPSGPGKQFLAIELATTIAPFLNKNWA